MCPRSYCVTDEEKAEAKTKKEEEKARKAEAKRLRDEEKRKPKAKNAVEPNEERPNIASEPPVLSPIPMVDPISSDEEHLERPQQRTTLMEEIKLQAEETKQASLLEERQKAEASAGSLGDEPMNTLPPEPVEPSTITESVPSTAVAEPSEANKSPSTESDITSPTKPQASSVAPFAVLEAESAPKKQTETVQQRIALPTATTETTVSGPDPTSKPAKGESKVSTWLKNKLRRSSKANKPEGAKDAPAEMGGKSFVGGASLTAPTTSTSKNSTDQGGDSSVREVAVASKKPASSDAIAPTSAALSAPIDAPAAAPLESDDDDNDDELYAASTRGKDKGKARSRSLSLVSSLSSDEGEHPRGRSQLRRETTTESEENEEDEFEEARDTFETEKLAPPGALRELRVADSPVRDSKFSEIL